MTNKEKIENEANTKLEELVNEVIIRRRIEKKMRYDVRLMDEQQIKKFGGPQTSLYRHSYQVVNYC